MDAWPVSADAYLSVRHRHECHCALSIMERSQRLVLSFTAKDARQFFSAAHHASQDLSTRENMYIISMLGKKADTRNTDLADLTASSKSGNASLSLFRFSSAVASCFAILVPAHHILVLTCVRRNDRAIG